MIKLVKLVVALTTFFGWMALGAAAGWAIGEFAPGGIAGIAEPFSPLRDAEAEHDAVLGAVVGAVLCGILFANRARRSRE